MIVNTPVLLLLFNRPKLTRTLIERLQKVKPLNIYVSIDGPRNIQEKETCIDVENIIKSINWSCNIKYKINKLNLGCKKAVISALDWFFSEVESGIILEDDILPSEDFFHFAAKMLHDFKDDSRIGVISGCNFAYDYPKNGNENIYFSNIPNIWGWATWKRVWQNYDPSMKGYKLWLKNGGLNQISNIPFFEYYWKDQLNSVYNNKIDTWDFQFYFKIWQMNLLSIVPTGNLVTNLGYGIDATHTNGKVPDFIKNMRIINLTSFNVLDIPVKANKHIDDYVFKKIFKISLVTIFKSHIRRIPIIGVFLAKLNRFL